MKDDILEILDDHINHIMESINEEKNQSLSQDVRAKFNSMRAELEEQLESAYGE